MVVVRSVLSERVVVVTIELWMLLTILIILSFLFLGGVNIRPRKGYLFFWHPYTYPTYIRITYYWWWRCYYLLAYK